MADYTGSTSLAPLAFSAPRIGTIAGIRLQPLLLEAPHVYGFISTGGGSAGRPLTGQLYPRGNK